MKWSTGIRRFHRWLALVFTAAVVATSIALAQEDPADWATYLPLLPLALLQLTGLYLLAHPLASKWRSARRTG